MQYHAGVPGMAIRSSSRPRRPIKRYGEEVNDASGSDKKVRRCIPNGAEYDVLKNLLNSVVVGGELNMLGKRSNVAMSKQQQQQLNHCCLKLDSGPKAKRATDFHEKVKEEFDEESQAMQLKLSKEQVSEYRRLKAEVERRCTILSTDLDNKLREQEAANKSIDYDKRRLHLSNARLQQKQAELDREHRNLEALRERESEQIRLLDEEREHLKGLQIEVTKSKESKRRLEEDLQHVCKEIADAHGDPFDTERNQRQHEAVENLKRVFAKKVYGRLVDLCQPSQKRYQIAVTRVLSKHMMSIVYDNEETGRECIAYLREHHYPPETLLPLTELCMEQIEEHLRDVRESPEVELAFDVINVPPSNAQNVVRKALQFVCGNSLVCKTPYHARQVAYGTDGRTERFRAVALDGTQFQPNGVISGGSADLKEKAKKWDENTNRKLKDRRSVLQEDLLKLQRIGKRKLDVVEMKRNQIHLLEARLRFAQQELEIGENETMRRLEQDVLVETTEPETIKSRIENRQIEIAERKIEIERLEQRKNALADAIFAQFCAKTGINHIREYEHREMRIHEQHQQRLNQYNSGSFDQNMFDAQVTNSNTVDNSQPGTSSQSHCETTQFQPRSLEAAEEIEIDYSDIKRETQYEEDQKAVEQSKHGNLEDEEEEEEEADGNLEDEEEEEEEAEKEDGNFEDEEEEEDESKEADGNLENEEEEEEKADGNFEDEEEEEDESKEAEKADGNLENEEEEEEKADGNLEDEEEEEEEADGNLEDEEEEEDENKEAEKEDGNFEDEEEEEDGSEEAEKEDGNFEDEEEEEDGSEEAEKKDGNASPPVSSKRSLLLTRILSIDLFERRRFINGNTKALCKLCGDSIGVDLEALIRHIATNEDRHHQPYAVKLLREQLEREFPIKSSEPPPPSLVLTGIDILLFVRAIWDIGLFERRRFIGGRTKALCKLCGDSLCVDLETLIRHIATNEDCQHLRYAVKLLQKQLNSAIAQPPAGQSAPVQTIQIFVRLLTRSTISLKVQAENTVADVKEMIEAKEGFSRFDQQLIFAGKQLEEKQTLADGDVQEGSILHLVLCRREE